MDTVLLLSLIFAFCPLLISISCELITIFIPSVVSIVMPPAPFVSSRVIVATSVLSTFFSGTAGFTGISSCAQKQPVQIGYSVSPCSNSIQTKASLGGTRNSPTPLPPYGVQGSAQPHSLSANTSCILPFM